MKPDGVGVYGRCYSIVNGLLSRVCKNLVSGFPNLEISGQVILKLVPGSKCFSEVFRSLRFTRFEYVSVLLRVRIHIPELAVSKAKAA